MLIRRLIKLFWKELICSRNYRKRLKVDTMPPNENPNDKMKMYILIDRDNLSLVQCGVQAAHAVAEFMQEYGDKPRTQAWVKDHKTMIFLEGTQQELRHMKEHAAWCGYVYKGFKEPDLNDLETAVVFEPMQVADGKELFSRFKLLS